MSYRHRMLDDVLDPVEAWTAAFAPLTRLTKTAKHHLVDPEIDIIVESTDRVVVAIEVKLAATATDRHVRHLNRLRQELGERVVERVCITTGQYAHRRRDGVAVVPLGLFEA